RPADPAAEASERIVPAHQPRQQVLELRQLDLQLAVGALRASSKYIKYQLRPIEDLQGRRLGNMTRLQRRQVAVEDEQVRAQRHRADEDVLQLALADQRARVGIAAALQDGIEDFDAGGARELGKFRERCLR